MNAFAPRQRETPVHHNPHHESSSKILRIRRSEHALISPGENCRDQAKHMAMGRTNRLAPPASFRLIPPSQSVSQSILIPYFNTVKETDSVSVRHTALPDFYRYRTDLSPLARWHTMIHRAGHIPRWDFTLREANIPRCHVTTSSVWSTDQTTD